MFVIHKIVSEYAKRIYGYICRRYTKLKTDDISGNNGQNENFSDPNFLFKMGWIKPKTISPFCPFKGKVEILINISLCTVLYMPRYKMLLSGIFLLYFIPCGFPCTQYPLLFLTKKLIRWQKVMENSLHFISNSLLKSFRNKVGSTY